MRAAGLARNPDGCLWPRRLSGLPRRVQTAPDFPEITVPNLILKALFAISYSVDLVVFARV